MSSCEEIRERLIADDPSARSHAAECAGCAQFEADLRAIRPLMEDADEIALRPGLAREIQARLRPTGPRPALRWPLSLAAVMLLGIAIGFFSQQTSAPDPELVRTELAEHLQVSRLFFRQAENVERREEIAAELEATRLSERTDRLLKYATDPDVRDFLSTVHRTLSLIRSQSHVAAIRKQVEESGVIEKIGRVEEATGLKPRPVEVSVADDDPFLQGRARLYGGRYEEAEKLFESLDRSDARYWQGFAANLQGKNVEALRSWSGLPKSWLDQKTLAQLQDLTVRMNAKFGEQPAREMKPEDLQKLFQSKPCVLVLKSATTEPIVTMGRTMAGGIPKGIPGFSVRLEGDTTWIEVDMDQLKMSEREKEALIKLLKMSMSKD